MTLRRNKGTRRGEGIYSVELPPFISIVRHPGRPVALGVHKFFWAPTKDRKSAEHCFESTVSEERTHWVFGQLFLWWVLRDKKNSVSSVLHTNTSPRGAHWVLSLSLELGEGTKKQTHWVRCLKPCSPKLYSARLPTNEGWGPNTLCSIAIFLQFYARISTSLQCLRHHEFFKWSKLSHAQARPISPAIHNTKEITDNFMLGIHFAHLPSVEDPHRTRRSLGQKSQSSCSFLTWCSMFTPPAEMITQMTRWELFYVMAGASLHGVYVMTPRMSSPRIFLCNGQAH